MWRITIWNDESGLPDKTLYAASLWTAIGIWWGNR